MIELLNTDCIEYMKTIPDKHFNLAVVDPPYGIGAGSKKFINGTSKTHKPYYKDNDWDLEPPKSEYFEQLFRVSKDQIVWGGNYFYQLWQSPCRGFIIWDKTIHGNSYADCEMAWTSFDKPARYFRENIAQTNSEGRIHQTQKSIKLYAWIFKHNCKDGFKILDTHLGSGSSAIAAQKMGFDFVGCEIDKEYFENMKRRFDKETDLPLFRTITSSPDMYGSAGG